MLYFYLAMVDTPEEKTKLEYLYKTYRKLMKMVANDILQDDFLSEDAVHQAFLQFIPNLEKFNDLDCHQTRNYLIIIVRRVCFAFQNERRKIIQIPLEEDREYDWMAASKDAYVAQMALSELMQEIDSLPEIYSDAIYLMYCEGYPIAEIARLQGISVSAAKKRLERARSQLKSLLEKEEEVMT